MGTMKALARLEEILQEIIERPQWLLTPKRVHPLELATAIWRALEEQVLPVGDRVLAPNRFRVRLHPSDYAAFEAVRRTLERELAQYVARAADERSLHLIGPPLVQFVPDERLQPGALTVETAFDEPSAPPVTVARPLPPTSGFTERIAPAPQRGPAQLPPTAAVEVLAPDGRVIRTVPLHDGVLTIGRRSDNDIALLDLEVSRRHARIDYVAPRYYLSDLGSTNGTRVNGRPVDGRQPLHPGDIIEVGSTRLRFRIG
jgi:hypothetical protein